MFRFAASTLPVTLRRMGMVAMACSVAALSACGGGDRAKAYQPSRIVSFGDENSAIDSYTDTASPATLTLPDGTTGATIKGLVYTINTLGITTSTVCNDLGTSPSAECLSSSGLVFGDTGSTPGPTNYVVFPDKPANFFTTIEHQTGPAYQRTTDTFYSCNTSSIWVQVIAHSFGLGYKTNCPTDADGAVTYAAYKANVNAVVAQVAAHRGELGSGVLVTMMAGQADIMDLYALVQGGSMTQASAEAELRNRAGVLANAVKDIISTGAKVVLSLTPDLGQSPLAVTGGGNQALLSDLTKVFNDTLYITNLGNQSGRNLAGVNPEPFTEPSVRSTAYYYDYPACDVTQAKHPGGAVESVDLDLRVKFCTTSTLVADVATNTLVYMWADQTHFTPSGHNLIGSAGYNRASNQF